jgi:hypothetical protein
MRALAAIFFALLLVASIPAQRQQREPLTEKQQDQIAEAGTDPVARVNLYIKFLDEHADTIKGLVKRTRSAARARRIDDELEDFAALADEFDTNLDVYAERKADIRLALKGMNEAVLRWQEVLQRLPSEPGFEISLKDGLASLDDLAAQTKRLTADQEAYFKAHKNENGQERWEPK